MLIKVKNLAVGEIHFNDESFTKYSETSGVCHLSLLVRMLVLIIAQYFFYYHKNIIKLLFLIINYK